MDYVGRLLSDLEVVLIVAARRFRRIRTILPAEFGPNSTLAMKSEGCRPLASKEKPIALTQVAITGGSARTDGGNKTSRGSTRTNRDQEH